MKNLPEHAIDLLFSGSEILPTITSSIVIPVKDEEGYILKTLSSFAKQVDVYGNQLDPEQFEVLILANNCRDGSVELIKGFQNDYPHINIYLEEVILPSHQANIGYVRRKLMECAYARLCKNGGGIIMTTDGDTMVASDWISQTQQEINHGAEVVGGRILLSEDELEGLDEFTRLYHFQDEKYNLLIAELEGKIINPEHDPVPRHHQHFNGSFAITTGCYAKSGGVPLVNNLEDCAFFEKLESIDVKIRHSYKVTVNTSARCIGRAEIGLSFQLNAWKNLGNHLDEYLVESCDSIINRLIQKRNLIELWKFKNLTLSDFNQRIKQIMPDIILKDKIYESFLTTCHFGQWYNYVIQMISQYDEKPFPDVYINTAIEDLQKKAEEYSNYDFTQISIL